MVQMTVKSSSSAAHLFTEVTLPLPPGAAAVQLRLLQGEEDAALPAGQGGPPPTQLSQPCQAAVVAAGEAVGGGQVVLQVPHLLEQLQTILTQQPVVHLLHVNKQTQQVTDAFAHGAHVFLLGIEPLGRVSGGIERGERRGGLLHRELDLPGGAAMHARHVVIQGAGEAETRATYPALQPGRYPAAISRSLPDLSSWQQSWLTGCLPEPSSWQQGRFASLPDPFSG